MLLVRTHVVLPRELLREIDTLAGRRGRSRFISEALEAELKRRRRVRAFESFAGSVTEGDVPEWATARSTGKWLRELKFRPGDGPQVMNLPGPTGT